MAAAKKEQTNELLMPKATAVWLIDNTALSFRQIANFVNLTEIEIEALANEEVGYGLVGRNPVEHNELTQDEIDRCQSDSDADLKRAKNDLPQVRARSKGPKYTPVSKRGDKPDAIAYILKHNPEISDAQICKLIGTTKTTIKGIRERTHANMQNIKPRHPADLGLCTYKELEAASEKGLRAAGKDPAEVKAQREGEKRQAEEDRQEDTDQSSSGFDFSNFLGKSGGL